MTPVQKKITIIAVALALVVAIVFAIRWFWSLGESTLEAYPTVRIEPVAGEVQWHRQGETAWKDLQTPVDLFPGDEVKTGRNGEARFVWGDRGITRIQPNSTVAVETSPSTGEPATGRIVRLNLMAGSLWSRFQKLLDLNSQIETHVGDVVATVRGTGFGISKTQSSSTELAVTDSVVSIGSSFATSPTFVREGQWGSFASSGKPVTVRDLTPGDAWAAKQSAQDAQEWQDWKQQVEQDLARLDAENPHAPSVLIAWSEQAHLALLGGPKQEELHNAYLIRNLAHKWIKNELPSANNLFIPKSDEAHERLVWELQRFLKLAELDSTHQNWIEPLRSWRGQLFSKSSSDRFYMRLLTLDEDIDQVILPGTIKTALAANPQAVAPLRDRARNLERELKSSTDLDQHHKDLLHDRLVAIEARLDLTPEPDTDLVPPLPMDIVATSTPAIPTSTQAQTIITQPTETPTPTAATIPATPKPTYARASVFATPSSAKVGDRISLRMMATRQDGTVEDVTTRTNFSTGKPTDGTISGNIFSPTQSGQPTLFGTISDQGTPLTASTIVSIGGQVIKILSSIAVQSTVSSAGCNARVPFNVIAYYSDGSSQDVTSLSSLSVSDPQLLVFSGPDLYTGCPRTTASASLLATYSESGTSKSGSHAVQITPPPSTTTTAPAPTTTLAPSTLRLNPTLLQPPLSPLR